jgi:hypothetical protein
MIEFIIVILVLILLIKNIYDPYIDYFYDYRGEYHIILWYNSNGERKYVNIIGDQ